jgi:hypothetical protein
VPVFVPLNVAAEHSEIVFNVASLLTILVMGRNAWGLRSLPGRSSWIVTKRFPISLSHVLDLKAPCNATKNNRFVKDSDGCWVDILEGVSCREGTSSVDNAGESVGCVPGHVTEELPRRVEVAMESGEVIGLKLICFEVTKGTFIAAEVFLEI